MEIKKDFEKFKALMKDEEKAERLISKSYLKVKKIDEVKISPESIECVYHLDSRYSYLLTFKKTAQGTIDFSINIPHIAIMVVIGLLLGLRFIGEVGYLAPVLGIGLFYGISWIFSFVTARGIEKRINQRWSEVA